MNPQTIIKVLRLVFGIALAATFAFMAFRNMDWAQAWQVFSHASPLWMIVGLVALAVDYTLRIVRWWFMMRTVAPELKLKQCFGPFLASIALNNVLPFRAGDIARAFGFQKQLGVPPVKTLGTMLVERLLDLVTLLGFLYAGLAIAGPEAVPPAFIKTAGTLAFIGVGMLVASLVFPTPFLNYFKRLEVKHADGESSAKKLAHIGTDLFSTLRAMRTPQSLTAMLGLSVLSWFLEGVLFACAIRAIEPSANLVSGWFSLALGTLATLIPSTPGYVGTFDFFAKAGYQAFGATETLSGIAALLAHVLIWVPLTLAGGGWLLTQAGWKGLVKPKSQAADTL